MRKPTNRTNEKEIYKLYEKRNLMDYKVTTVEDIEAIHNYNILAVEGYTELSEENKTLYRQFFVKFLNSQGMGTRMSIFPYSIHFVSHIKYIRSSSNPERPNVKIYEIIGSKTYTLKEDGDIGTLEEDYFRKGFNTQDVSEVNSENFLRIDLQMDEEKIWLHIIEPDRWY